MLRWLTGRKANPFRLFDPNEPSRGVPEPVDGGRFPDGTGWVLVRPADVRLWFADFPDGWLTGDGFTRWVARNRTAAQGWRVAEWMDDAQARHPYCALFLLPPPLVPSPQKPPAPLYPRLYREG